MARVFDTIISKGVRSGQVPARTEQARNWYRDTAAGYKRISDRAMIRESGDRLTSRIAPGNMYMYMYDPKFKETLPFYDRFPLVFPFRVESDRFWGLNLHYIAPQHRAVLMDSLYDLTTNERYDETTKLRLSYETLNRASRFRYFKPCVKQYLFSHLATRFIYIYPSEWDIALFLPTERFTKATKTQVFANSRKLIGAS